MKTIVQLIFLILISSVLSGQDISGHWYGSLDVYGKKLRIVFHINKTDSSYSATMDSPDQNARDIPVTATNFTNPDVKIELSKIGVIYEGKLAGNSVTGMWKQSNQSFPLTLSKEMEKTFTERKIAIPKARIRPQEPGRPYPYREEEVFFENAKDGITLAGTLTLPNKSGTYPAVILISGSGPQNRDEEVFEHKPFLVLADHLTRQGIAVLRYDDRGFNKSTGVFANATTKDFATDVVSAVQYLKSRKEIDKQNIGLIGHSEGGIIAPIAANQCKDVAFVVLLAGTGIPGKEIMIIQARTFREFDVPDENAYQQYVRKAIEISMADKDVSEIRKELKEYYLNSSILNSVVPPGTNKETLVNNLVSMRTTPWMRYFCTYNPSDEVEKMTCPVLSLNGSRDIQVTPGINQAAIKKALEKSGNKDFLVKELPGLNHFFQECKTGLPGEYAEIQQTFSPIALEEITTWIRSHVKPAPF